MRAAGAPLVLVLAACMETGARPAVPAPEPAAARDAYLGIETRLLDDDLVNLYVAMAPGASDGQLDRYARCAAARYALIRGFGFARHVRTTISEEGGVRRADAVYTVSPALPAGLRTIDAEVTVADCAERGIPTI